MVLNRGSSATDLRRREQVPAGLAQQADDLAPADHQVNASDGAHQPAARGTRNDLGSPVTESTGGPVPLTLSCFTVSPLTVPLPPVRLDENRRGDPQIPCGSFIRRYTLDC